MTDGRPVYIYALLVEAGGDWALAERRWIEYYRSLGFDLTNLTDGGEGVTGVERTDEWRAKTGEATRRRFRDDPAFVERWNEAMSSRPPASAETRAKISEAMRRVNSDPEMRKRRGASTRGKPRSEEARAKISASKMGHACSDETRAKMSESQKRVHERRRLERERAQLAQSD